MKVPTLRVSLKNGGTVCLINADTFDESLHTLVEEPSEAPAPEPAPAPAPAPAPVEEEDDDEDDKPYTQAELSGMTVGQMKAIPLYERLTRAARAGAANKQELIQALLEAQSK